MPLQMVVAGLASNQTIHSTSKRLKRGKKKADTPARRRARDLRKNESPYHLPRKQKIIILLGFLTCHASAPVMAKVEHEHTA